MPDLTVDGRRAAVPEGATLLDAARSLGIQIPTLCVLEGHPHHTSCMVCLVEDTGSASLVPACATPASGGQAVLTDSARVRAARKATVELLLSEHRGDCEAPCLRACPAHLDIPRLIRRIVDGDTEGALAAVMERLPLAWSIELVCPAPCERACRRKLVDSPEAIRSLVLSTTDPGLAGPALFTPSSAPSTGKSVAIVGAGPAGLAAAYFLALEGHKCAVLDERNEPGGKLRQAVAEGRLAAAALDADISVLQRMGIELRANQPVAGAAGVERLRERHDALILATGSAKSLAGLLPSGIRVDARTGACSLPGVFAGGSATRTESSSLAVRAVASGRALAAGVGLFLAGLPVDPHGRRFDSHRGSIRKEDLSRMADLARSRAEGTKAEGIRSDRMEAVGAAAEGLRCLRCDCARKESCGLRRAADGCGADARGFPGEEESVFERIAGAGGLAFEPGKCIKCGICVRIAERGGDRPGLSFSARGFDLRVRVPFGEDIGKALPSTAAECVKRCPTGALAWDR